MRLRSFGLLLSLAVLVLLLAWPVQGAPPSDGAVVVRIRAEDPAELRRLARMGLDLLEMRDGPDRFALVSRGQVARLRALGLAAEVDPEQTALLARPATVLGGYRTVEEVRARLEGLAAAHPRLARTFVYGESWERGQGKGGYELFGIELTNRDRPGPKPTFFLMAAIHAREMSTAELALRFVEDLLAGYGQDGDATWLLDHHRIVVVPLVNPDGRVWAQQGYYQRKNRDTAYGTNCAEPPTPYDQYGVDLNRNHSFRWGTVNTPDEPPCGQTFPGPAPASEPETAALQDLVRSLFPDQRGPGDADPAPDDAAGILITLHSYSELVLWPWGWTATPAPNAADLERIGRRLAGYNGYQPGPSYGLYPTSGTTDDWAYGELGIAAFTFEVGPASGTCGGFFPPFSCVDGFWSENRPALYYAARIARAPYLLSRGPAPEAFRVVSVLTGTVTVEGTLDDRWTGLDPIVAAEVYVDVPPWEGGTPLPLTAADGALDSPWEVVTGTLSLPPGRHLLFLRGRDAQGNWGPVRGVWAEALSVGKAWLPVVAGP